MKRTILAITTIAILSLSVKAQDNSVMNKNGVDTSAAANKIRLSIGMDEGIPLGVVAKQSSFAIGGSLQAEYMVLKDLGVTLSAGYLYFAAKNGNDNLSYLPVLGGLNYYFRPKIYLSGQLGASFDMTKGSDKEMNFSYAQGVGFQVSKRMDILLKFQGVNVASSKNYSFVGGRIAYTISKRK